MNTEICCICGRVMFHDGSIDEHHFVPKSRGGKSKHFIHKVCHRFIHSQWTEKELEVEYSCPETIKATPEAQKFISFISKKDPSFYDLTISSNEKRRKKRKK